VNTEPLPGSLVTVTSPPIMRASLRVMLEQPLARLIEHLLGQVPFRDIARHLGKADQLASIVMDRIDHDACPERMRQPSAS
jgi:hypothetical protein